MTKAAERSVREIVADTVVALVVGGVIENTATSISRSFTATGIGQADIDQAVRRHQERAGLATVPFATWFEFDPVGAPTSPPDVDVAVVDEAEVDEVEPFNPGSEFDAQLHEAAYEERRAQELGRPLKQRPTKLRPDRIGPDTGVRELTCSECNEWKPTDAFRPRVDRPGLFTSRCRSCLSGYVKARYVSTQVEETLGKANLALVVDADSNIVGLACADCGTPFATGDHVIGEAFLTHRECPA